jgi:hypothetical protein
VSFWKKLFGPKAPPTVGVAERQIVFDHEENRIAAGFPATYRYYKGPSEASAMAFLERQSVTARSFFIVVQTPEGVFCKDCDGLWIDP